MLSVLWCSGCGVCPRCPKPPHAVRGSHELALPQPPARRGTGSVPSGRGWRWQRWGGGSLGSVPLSSYHLFRFCRMSFTRGEMWSRVCCGSISSPLPFYRLSVMSHYLCIVCRMCYPVALSSFFLSSFVCIALFLLHRLISLAFNQGYIIIRTISYSDMRPTCDVHIRF